MISQAYRWDVNDPEVITCFAINPSVPVFEKDVVAAPPAWRSRCICFLVFRLNIIDMTFYLSLLPPSVCVLCAEACVFRRPRRSGLGLGCSFSRCLHGLPVFTEVACWDQSPS